MGKVVFRTRLGWVGVEAGARGVRRVTLPLGSEQAALTELGPGPLTTSAGDLQERIMRYFEGEVVDFPDALDLDGATPFQREVWEATQTIPYGQVRSYAWIARRIGRPQAARPVGQALGANPVPIVVPCHRVVGSDGGLCGFGGGLALKRQMLVLEKADLQAVGGVSPSW